MDPSSVAIFVGVVVLLIALILSEVPVAFALILSATLGILVTKGSGVASSTVGTLPFNSTSSYSLAVVPLYILMGSLAAKAGLARDLFDVAHYHMRKLPGGLAIAGITGCAGFAAVTGSSVATVASVGRTAIEEMRRHGYDPAFAGGAVAIAGTLGILIPPSVVLVLFGIVTGTSIGSLLIAGIIPGILSALAYGGVVLFLVARDPRLAGQQSRDKAIEVPSARGGASGRIPHQVPLQLAPGAADGEQTLDGGRRRPAPAQYFSLAKVLLLFGIVVGGVFTGLYTATEAGAIGAVAALVMLFLAKRPKGRRLVEGIDGLVDSARLTSNVFFIVVGGAIFTFFVVSLGVPRAFAEWAIDLPIPNWLLVVVILAAMVPLGMILDSISIVLVFVPIVFPIIEAMGFNGVWFGILAVKLIEIGLVTPPVGLNVFVISASVPDLPAEKVFRGVVPFLIVDTAVVALLFGFPDIALFLPNMMRG